MKGGRLCGPPAIRPPTAGSARAPLVHWRKTSSTSTTSPLRGARPLTARGSRRAGSVVSVARPLSRSVSSTPGIRNSIPTWGFSRTLLNRIHAVVAEPIRQHNGAIVEDRDEPRGVAARRAVDAPAGSGRGENHERRKLDETPAVPVQPIERLPDGALARLPVAAPELLHRIDDMVHHGPPRIRVPTRRPSCATRRNPLKRVPARRSISARVRSRHPRPTAWRRTSPPRRRRRRRPGRISSRRRIGPPTLRAAPR